MRLVFAGTPEPALPALRRLIASPRHDVIAVLTRPDAISGRRGKPTPSPVARLAAERASRSDPDRPNFAEFVEQLTECASVAPLWPTARCCGRAAGRAHARLGEPALLTAARWRGAAPVQAAVAAGDTVTGATTFRIERDLDSGPVYGVVTETIRPEDTAGELLQRLSLCGAALLESTMDGIADGSLVPAPQPADGVSFARKITVDDARVRWELPAQAVERRIRAVTPSPGAWTMIGGARVKIGPVTLEGEAESTERLRRGSCG